MKLKSIQKKNKIQFFINLQLYIRNICSRMSYKRRYLVVNGNLYLFQYLVIRFLQINLCYFFLFLSHEKVINIFFN